MKFIKQFATDELMNEAALQIHHKDGAFVYQSQTTKFIDERHPGPNCLMLGSVNMEPVKLDASSSKKKPAVADILYSTSDGKLTLDAQTNNVNNTAIAICVIPEVTENFKNGDDSTGAVKTARFVSINYMSCETPITGSKSYNNQSMMFGNIYVKIGNKKGNFSANPYDRTSYPGGKQNTQLCLSSATKQDKKICNGVTNSKNTGYCAPACCCVAYSTLGTKPGDWYLPTISELHDVRIYRNIINEKRIALVGSAFYGDCYWTSCENNQNHEYYVDLADGGYSDYNNRDSNYHVLAFLALKY